MYKYCLNMIKNKYLQSNTIIQYLEFIGIDETFTNFKDEFGNTILIYATLNKDLNLIKYLIKHGANTNIKNNDNFSAILYAEDLEIIKYLFLFEKDFEIINLIYNKYKGDDNFINYLIHKKIIHKILPLVIKNNFI